MNSYNPDFTKRVVR